MRNIFLASNLVYLAPIRDNSSKHKWFHFLTFKINSSLVWKVGQDLQKNPWLVVFRSVWVLRCCCVLPVTSFWGCLIHREHLHSNQNHLGLRQNRAVRPNTFQSWFYTTWDTSCGLILSDACHGFTCAVQLQCSLHTFVPNSIPHLLLLSVFACNCTTNWPSTVGGIRSETRKEHKLCVVIVLLSKSNAISGNHSSSGNKNLHNNPTVNGLK